MANGYHVYNCLGFLGYSLIGLSFFTSIFGARCNVKNSKALLWREAWSHLEYFSEAAWLNPGDQWQNTNWALVFPESWATNYCFRLLSVGMICYSAVDEGYRSHTSSCVDCAGSCLRISWSGQLLQWFKVRGFAESLNFSVVIPEMLCGLWEFILQDFLLNVLI